MNNLKDAITKAMPLVLKAAKPIWNIEADKIRVNDDPDYPFIDIDNCFTIAPVVDQKESITGPREVMRWDVMSFTHHPGSFNPYNGGTGPETDEHEHGRHDRIDNAILEVARLLAADILAGIGEELMYEEMKRDEEMNPPPEPESTLCPHGEEYHECNDCLVAGDLAFDAMREGRLTGRRF